MIKWDRHLQHELLDSWIERAGFLGVPPCCGSDEAKKSSSGLSLGVVED